MESGYVKLRDIKPVLAGYIVKSQTLIRRDVIPDEKVIHDVRVLMKKSRAVFKLTGSQLDEISVKRDMVSLREVGRIMCLWRETSVHRKTLKELKKDNPGIFSPLSDNDKIVALLRKGEPLSEPSDEIKAALGKIDELLRKAGFRLRFQSMKELDPQLLLQSLEKTYRDAVKQYIKCRNSQNSDELHEFRKIAKDFLYQLYFFRPLNPQVVKSLEKRVDLLTQNLGKFNDLTRLIETLDYNYKAKSSQVSMDELVIKIREKQDRYLARVWPSAYKVFCPGQELVTLLGFKVLVV